MKCLIPAACLLLCVASHVYAAESGENTDARNAANKSLDDGDAKHEYSITNFFKDKLPVPAEQSFTAPDLATLGNWAPIRNNYAWGNVHFIVSKDSLSVGDKDKLVRYAVGIPLRNGKYNYVYEGMDCDTGQSRSYYYGNSDNPVWAPLNRPWERIQEKGYNTYQAPLYDALCSMRDPLSIKDMKSALGSSTTSQNTAKCPACHTGGEGASSGK
ncbi:CNP1-like family protein [Silvimonas iriomotensis]|uniref:CNP1-like uncharacterized domain-containing protein n=1 Tax=Silvimonas iriomotensis TaxID=449662 RepID=A0ABQ2PF42_9NEIS|nr:CNP1-like family protein [Silvimonas iriomotensis]GGP23886.1 hypothetical protein GCM10010970_38860 [Silvimonas iriomotensis]